MLVSDEIAKIKNLWKCLASRSCMMMHVFSYISGGRLKLDILVRYATRCAPEHHKLHTFKLVNTSSSEKNLNSFATFSKCC
jgi:hypothetical protein